MVYTSQLPPYMDPANWQQQQPNHQVANTGANTPLLIPTPQSQPTNPAPSQPHGGSIRPGSLADRARMANIPMQEQPQKCPRCDSTNTKFCYFNNYSLSQPRHFCKACRRYWTRNGALRNVPVGGGCRRNKRTKGSSSTSKSPVSLDRQTGTANSGSSVDMAGLGSPAPPPMRFTAPLHQLGNHFGELGLNYGLISGPMGGVGDLNFHLGSNLGGSSGGVGGGGVGAGSGNGSTSILPVGGFEQWRMPQTHQFPFLSGMEAPSSSHGFLYPFEGGGGGANSNQAHGYGGGVPKVSTNSGVKMEDNQQLGLSRQFLGMINSNNNNNNNNPNSEQYWSAGGATSAWTDLSAFSTSSTTSNQINYRT